MEYIPANKVCSIPPETLKKVADLTFNKIIFYDSDTNEKMKNRLAEHYKKLNQYPAIIYMTKEQYLMIKEDKELNNTIKMHVLALGISD